jgi:hypothetical protein
MHKGHLELTKIERHCGLCKWHEKEPIKNRYRNLYRHYCTHIKFSSPVRLGAHEENSDLTPDWCPVAQAKKIDEIATTIIKEKHI